MPSETSQYTIGLADVVSVPSALRGYVLATLSGTATLSGFYVNLDNLQEGAAVSYAITTTPQTFTQLYNGLASNIAGAVLPNYIHGFIGRLTVGAMSFNLSGNRDGTFVFAPDIKCPVMAVSDQITFGRA